MIEIVTLFLGLYHGLQTVELQVTAPVAEIELRLDGDAVARLKQPPWSARLDLGPVLAPHELIAVAHDAQGGELGRTRRWINQAGNDEATVVVLSLDPGVRLPPVAAMQDWFWADGECLEVLRIEKGAAEVMIVRDPAVQPYLERTASFFFQLRLAGQPRLDDATLTDKQAFVAANRRLLLQQGNRVGAELAGAVWEQWRDAFSFGDDAGVLFISPRAAPPSRVAGHHGIFNFSQERPSNDSGLLWHSAVVRPLDFRPRISDAVAMAGLEAHGSRGRRAVVLLMLDDAIERSSYPPAAVQDFLGGLQVPFYVWGFGVVDADTPAEDGETAGGWREARDLTHGSKLDPGLVADWLGRVAAAAEEVRQELRRQRVVWLRGGHASHRVELSAQAAGVRFAGTSEVAEGED